MSCLLLFTKNSYYLCVVSTETENRTDILYIIYIDIDIYATLPRWRPFSKINYDGEHTVLHAMVARVPTVLVPRFYGCGRYRSLRSVRYHLLQFRGHSFVIKPEAGSAERRRAASGKKSDD